MEVENIDKFYTDKKKGIEIKVDRRNELWGERHFTIEVFNRIGIDIVIYTQPIEN
ncbi:VOC family protein [Aquimarina sp. M1]